MIQYFITTDEVAALNVNGHNPKLQQLIRDKQGRIAVIVHSDNGYYDESGVYTNELPKDWEAL